MKTEEIAAGILNYAENCPDSYDYRKHMLQKIILAAK